MKNIQCDDDLEDVNGMKETIFFYIILQMLKEGAIDRIHTYPLEMLLTNVMGRTENLYSLERVVNKLSRYPIKENPVGICFIFCEQIRKEGDEKDEQIISELFKELKYDVIVLRDPTPYRLRSVAERLESTRYMFYDR